MTDLSSLSNLRPFKSDYGIEKARYQAWYSTYQVKGPYGSETEEILIRFRVSDKLVYGCTIRKANGLVYHMRRGFDSKLTYRLFVTPQTEADFPMDKRAKLWERIRQFSFQGRIVDSNFMFPRTYEELFHDYADRVNKSSKSS